MGIMNSFKINDIFKKLATITSSVKKNIIGERLNNEVRELPDDVWVEILRRIPTVDLVRLKAVCKTFHRLISDDLFTRLHANGVAKLHPKATKAIISKNMASHSNYYDPDKRTISVSYDETRLFDWCSHVWSAAFGEPLLRCSYRHLVLDSYHGILLLKMCDRLLLYNPITRSYKFLPSISLGSSLDYFGSWKIAYDDVSNQYKVSGLALSPRWRWRGTLYTLYVFDAHGDGESHSPRVTTTKDVEVGYEIIRMESVLVRGSVYWLMITKEEETWGTCIVSTNVTAEKVKTRTRSIITPFRVSCARDFFASNGMFYHLRRQSYYKHQLWVLEGVESENSNPSWTMKNIIDTKHLTSTLSTLHHFHAIHVLGVFRDKVLMIILPDHRLFQYNMRSQKFEEVAVTSSGNHITKVTSSGNHITGCVNRYSRIVEHIDSLIRF